MINCSRLSELLSNYDPNAHEDDVVKADEQRAELLARFPKEDWPAMTLEHYALGQPDQPDSFCRWMEFVTSTIGSIRGGSARKHLIYFQASTAEWWFDHKLYSNVEQAWEAVRSGFVRAIEFAESGAWDPTPEI
jgi:5-methylcytosine-specific restriction protein B